MGYDYDRVIQELNVLQNDNNDNNSDSDDDSNDKENFSDDEIIEDSDADSTIWYNI